MVDRVVLFAWLFSPFKGKIKAIRTVSKLTGVPKNTVGTIFNSTDSVPSTIEVNSSEATKADPRLYIPRVGSARLDYLLRWIDEEIPCKSGTDHRVIYGPIKNYV